MAVMTLRTMGNTKPSRGSYPKGNGITGFKVKVESVIAGITALKAKFLRSFVTVR
jgi:hypothetical protein